MDPTPDQIIEAKALADYFRIRIDRTAGAKRMAMLIAHIRRSAPSPHAPPDQYEILQNVKGWRVG